MNIINRLNKLKENIYFNIGVLVFFTVAFAFITLCFSAKPAQQSAQLLKSYLVNPGILIVNYLPILILVLFGYFVSNRMWIGMLTGGILPLILSFINCFLMKFRNNIFSMVDISLIGEAANMGERYSYFPEFSMILGILFIIGSAVFCAFFCKYKFKKRLINVCSAIAVVLVTVLSFEFIYINDSVYNKLSNIEKNSAFMNAANKNDQYLCRGFMYSFLNSASSLVQRPPEGYNQNEAVTILSEKQDDIIPDDKKINIISVMLEAYNDFSKFDSVTFKNDPYTLYHEIKEKSVHGQLFTNIFGGGTVDTERAFITGFSYMYDYHYPVDTYAKYFSNQGYTVEGGHPGHDWFYDRDIVNANFGFQNYYFLENRYQNIYDNTQHKIRDGILEDKYFLEDIISLYEQNKQSGKPYFNFSVSYQNHGPYETTKLLTDKIYVEKTPQMSDETYHIANNYFAGIEQTNIACKNLVEWADSQSEPIMVVLFGDHNPWMGNGMSGYYEMNINVNTATEEGLYNYYQTPYIIYANRAAKEAMGNECTGYGGDFSPMFLMNKVFELNGWGGSKFMKISNDLKQYIDIVTYTGQVRQNGVFTEYPDEAGYKALDRLRKVEYYMMSKKAGSTR